MASFKRVLVANRGEIAVRVMRTLREMGISPSPSTPRPTATAMHVRTADAAVLIGPAPSRESYLVIDKIIGAAKAMRADAIHPGYGFLSENPHSCSACEAAGIVFIGPPASAMDAMGEKTRARAQHDEGRRARGARQSRAPSPTRPRPRPSRARSATR